ncbi:MAG: hypothetical protein M3Z83_03875 [Actinomycetota bacterium]|nr:hypothetical protein [Actinomycetota bacterium]
MWSKATIGGVAVAAVLGATGVTVASAHAASTTTPTSTATSSAAPTKGAKATKKTAATGKHDGGRGLHAEWVTKDKTSGAFVTHEAIRGLVTAVSPTSITVQAEDGVSQTYSISPQTTVHLGKTAKDAKPTDGQISDVKTGQQVGVTGTGKDAPAATHIVVKKA